MSAALGQWLHLETTPHAVIDRQGGLRWANHAATTASAGALEVTQIVVRARERAQHERFLRAIDRAGASPQSLVLRDERSHTIIRLVEVGHHLREDWVGIRWTLAENFEVRYAALEEAFKLTPAEHAVLMSLASGNSAEEVAALSSKSLDTVRSHIRQVYAKLNVKSREQMFFRIQPFRL